MYNTKEEFLVEFQKWREENNYPKRDEVRELFRAYRDADPHTTVLHEVFDYILNQDKPVTFLDSLFKKDNSVCNSDPMPEIVQERSFLDPLIPSPTAKVPWAVLGKIKYANTGIFQLCAELQCEMQEYLSMSSDLWKYWQNESEKILIAKTSYPLCGKHEV